MAQARTREIFGKVSIDFMGRLKEYSSGSGSSDPIKLTETPSEVIVEFPVKVRPYTSLSGQEGYIISYETETFPRDKVSVRISAK